MRIHTCTRVPCVLLLVLAAVLPAWPAAAADLADCGFEPTDALDGDFEHAETPPWQEIDTLNNTWTAWSVYVTTGAAHSGSYLAVMEDAGDYIQLDGYGDTHGIGTVTFYYRAASASDSLNVLLLAGVDTVWQKSSNWSTTYQMATVVVNQPGDLVLRWNMSAPASGGFLLDDIVVTTYDSTSPNATVTATTPSPTSNSTVSFLVEFDEYVRNFDALDDLDIGRTGTLAYTGAVIDGGPQSYTVDVIGITGDGDLTLGVELASDVQDVAENALASSTTDTVTVDTTPPTAAVTAATPSPTNSDTVSFLVNFSENVSAFDAEDDLDIGRTGTLAYTGVTILGGPRDFTVSFTGVYGDGDLSLALHTGLATDVVDSVGHPLSSSGQATVSIDNTAPTASIELLDTNPTQLNSVDFLVTFSEPVSPSFSLIDLQLSGTLGSAAFATMIVADPEYTVTTWFSDPDEDGSIGIAIAAGAVTDSVGNPYAGDASDQYAIYNFHGFLVQPADTRLYVADAHSFMAQADCLSPTLHYQWKWDDGAKAVHDVGDDAPAFAINDAALAERGDYWCAVSYNDETYYSNTGTLEVEPHLEIVLEPEGADKNAGDTHTFTVATSGGYQPLVYAWEKNGMAIPDATSGIYTIDPLEVDDTGAYTVEISDDYTDTVESAPALLNVTVQVPAAGLAALIALAAACAIGGATVIRRPR